MKRERIQDLSTVKKLNKAFIANCLIPKCKLYQKPSINGHLPYGATVIYTGEISRPAMSDAEAKKIGLQDKTLQIMLWLGSDINPNGITCLEDKARAYTISMKVYGNRRLTQRRWERANFLNYYNYALTVEQAIKEFKHWLSDSFEPFKQDVQTGTYHWKKSY